MPVPMQPWQKLLMDLGLPFRITFENDLSTGEFMELLDLGGPKTERIIRARYGLDGQAPLSQRDVAAREGLTRQRVGQIEEEWKRRARARLGLKR